MQNTFQRLYTPSNFHKKNQFPNKPGFPLSKLIILDWYQYVSLFPDLSCKNGLSVSAFTQNTFQRLYTPSNFHKNNQFPNKPGFPLSKLIILDCYPYVSLFPDFLRNIGLSVKRFTQTTFQRLYTPSNFHKKISSQTNQGSRCLSKVNNFRLLPLRFVTF